MSTPSTSEVSREEDEVIGKKLVDRYAHQSGVKDQLVAEREVVLTYALGLLRETKAFDHLAFKGGTCLRKMVFGSTGRFSEDLDFTLRTDDDQIALTALYEAFHQEHHGIRFSMPNDWNETDDGFGMEVRYQHNWNSSGKFRLQVSSREKPTLSVIERPMIDQVYFRDLEFEPFEVPTLEPIEMAAEKVRAAFQRAKVRDLYDLFLLAKPDLQGDLLRRLVVLKLWQGDHVPADQLLDLHERSVRSGLRGDEPSSAEPAAHVGQVALKLLPPLVEFPVHRLHLGGRRLATLLISTGQAPQ